MGVRTFFLAAKAAPRAKTKKSALPHPSLAFRACGCGQDRLLQLIAIEAAMVVASNEKPKENDNG
jgi:hypothetical protein